MEIYTGSFLLSQWPEGSKVFTGQGIEICSLILYVQELSYPKWPSLPLRSTILVYKLQEAWGWTSHTTIASLINLWTLISQTVMLYYTKISFMSTLVCVIPTPVLGKKGIIRILFLRTAWSMRVLFHLGKKIGLYMSVCVYFIALLNKPRVHGFLKTKVRKMNVSCLLSFNLALNSAPMTGNSGIGFHEKFLGPRKQ